MLRTLKREDNVENICCVVKYVFLFKKKEHLYDLLLYLVCFARFQAKSSFSSGYSVSSFLNKAM